jgi:hypothetical protein
VEVTAKYHPTGDRFLTREYTKNGEHGRFKVDHAVSEMVREHTALHGIGPGQVIFPVRLFASTEAAGRDRLTQEQIDALGFTDELPNGRRYKHGRLGGYVTAKCRRRGQAVQLGLCARPQAPPDWTVGAGVVTRLAERPDRVPGRDVWRRIWNAAVDDAGGHHAVRQDSRPGRSEGRGRHIGDTRRRCLKSESLPSVTRDAASRKARLS